MLVEKLRSIRTEGLSEKAKSRFFYAIFVMVAANVLYYTYVNAIPHVKSDGWRFISIYLRPWDEGLFNLRSFFSDHHPQPLTASLFILNAKLFGLRMDYEALLGALFAVLFALRIIKLKRLQDKSYLSDLALILVTLSLVSTATYTWSLVTIGFIVGFFTLLIIENINQIAYRNISPTKFVMSLGGISLYMLIFGDSAKLLFFVLCTALVTFFILSRSKKMLVPLAMLVAAYLLVTLFLSQLDISSKYTAPFALQKILTAPFEHFQYFGVALLSPVVNLTFLSNDIGLSETAIVYLAYFAIIIYVIGIATFLYMKMYLDGVTPIVLIGLALVTALAAAAYRFDPETQSALFANVPRYYRMYSLGILGLIWIFSYSILKKKVFTRYIVVSGITLLCISHVGSSFIAWKTSPYVQKSITKVIEIQRRNASGDLSVIPPRYAVVSNFPEPYLGSLAYLKAHNLSIFLFEDLEEKYR